MPIINWLRSIFGGLFGKPAPYFEHPPAEKPDNSVRNIDMNPPTDD